MVLPLKKETVARNALLPFVLCNSTEEYKDHFAMTEGLAWLYGAEMVADVSKVGSNQIVTIYFRGLSREFTIYNEEMYVKYVNFLLNALLKPNFVKTKNGDKTFAESALELGKQEVIGILHSQKEDKQEYARNRCISEMFKDSEYALDPLSTEEEINKITADELKKAWEECLTNAKIEAFIWGPWRPYELIDIFKDKFADIKRENIYQPKPFSFNLPDKIRECREEMDVQQTKLVMGFKVRPNLTDKEINAVRFMTIIYGGYPCSKLFENAREKLSLCYYCSARYNKGGNYILLESGIDSGNIELAKREFIKQLDEIKNGNITDEEFECAKSGAMTAMKIVDDSLVDTSTFYFLQAAEDKYISTNDIYYSIREMTKEDVIKAANDVKLSTVYVLDHQEKEENK